MIKEGLRRNGRLAGFEVRISPHYFMGYSRHVPGRCACAEMVRGLSPLPGQSDFRPGTYRERAKEEPASAGAHTASACPPRPGAARAWTQDGRARVSRRFALTSLPAPFHGSFFCTVCACSLATLERRASQELASKAAHAHPTPIPWSVFSAPAEPGKSVAPRHRCAASSSCRSRRPRRADGA